ncbi:sialidase family protein [uncultured Kriegella sp.]|uniref:sialidase family protein n=1 Tax=uncultured Kriegella sp. TaxID=1798910 RepID=UPI0030DB2372|tara:strand:+ start:56767 stop:57927 length:1161 start_codon:yes stop_codon:yes gene_type:complete
MKTSKLIINCIVLVNFFLSGVVLAQSNDSFLLPPEVIVLPEKSAIHSVAKRQFTGIPSMAISNGGKIWSTWYTGITPKEDQNNYVVVSSSSDDGENWTETLVIDPDGPGEVRAYDPEIWIDPTGKLWVFWAQAIGHEGTVAGVWAITSVNPEAESPQWSEPKRLTDGIMMCKPTVLTNGDWVLPASTWRLTDNRAKLIVSTDNGLSWHERGAVNVPKDSRSYDEHMIIERNDGTLWMLVRTKYGVGESISKDQGKSWSELSPSKIQHPSARLFIRKLKSGNLLLVKHGPIDIKTERSHLMAFISKDDGESWSKGLLIDQRKGVSYPDGQENEDGKIYLVYDYNRVTDQNILITSFTENDILTSDYDEKILKVYKNRKTVSAGGTGQ